MKITFVASYLTVYGGGGIFLTDYANKLCERGHQVTIVSQKVDKNLYKFNGSIDVLEIGGPLPSNPLFWLKFNSIVKQFIRILSQLKSDINISVNFPSNYICSKFNSNESPKHIFFCNEPFRFFHDKKFYSNAPLLLRIVSWGLRLFYKKFDIEGTLAADEIIYNSKYTKKRGINWYGRDGIIHNIGIHTNCDSNNSEYTRFQQKWCIPDNYPVLFTLGLTHHLKGAKELILIFEKILKEIPDVRLLIGGWLLTENRILINKLIKKLNLPSENIIYAGFIERDLLDLFYQKSSLTLYTPIDEAYGLIPLESMKNGTPVVAFEGGPSDTIINGKSGYLVKSHDINSFSLKAIRVLKSKELYEKFSQFGKQLIKDNFDIEHKISELENILEDILYSN